MLYGHILFAERKAQQLTARISRRTPRWVKDLLAFVRYVNFVKLEPTFSALFFAPHHFHSKLEETVAGKTRYLTPVASLTTSATLVGLLVAKFGFGKLAGWDVFYWILFAMLCIAMTAPIWTLLFAKMVREMKNSEGIWSLLATRMWFDDSEDLLLSRRAWRLLRPGLYFQGMLYFTVYFVVALPILMLAAAGVLYGSLIGVRAVFTPSYEEIEAVKEPLAQIIAGITLLTAAALSSWLVVRPLGALFRNCLEAPTVEAYRIDLRELKGRIENAFVSHVTEQPSLALKESLRSRWSRAVAKMRIDEARVKNRSPELFEQYLKDRAEACLDMKGLAYFLEDETDQRLLDALDQMCEGKPMVQRDALGSAAG